MNITEQTTSTDYIGRGELPPWVDLDRLWPADLRAEVAAVIDDGMGWVDPDGPFMRWLDRLSAVAEQVEATLDRQELYDIDGELRRRLDAVIDYDALDSLLILLGRVDPESTVTEEGMQHARQVIADRLDR